MYGKYEQYEKGAILATAQYTYQGKGFLLKYRRNVICLQFEMLPHSSRSFKRKIFYAGASLQVIILYLVPFFFVAFQLFPLPPHTQVGGVGSSHSRDAEVRQARKTL